MLQKSKVNEMTLCTSKIIILTSCFGCDDGRTDFKAALNID